MGVWVYGCMDVWMYGCLGVWMYGYRMHRVDSRHACRWYLALVAGCSVISPATVECEQLGVSVCTYTYCVCASVRVVARQHNTRTLTRQVHSLGRCTRQQQNVKTSKRQNITPLAYTRTHRITPPHHTTPCRPTSTPSPPRLSHHPHLAPTRPPLSAPWLPPPIRSPPLPP